MNCVSGFLSSQCPPHDNGLNCVGVRFDRSALGPASLRPWRWDVRKVCSTEEERRTWRATEQNALRLARSTLNPYSVASTSSPSSSVLRFFLELRTAYVSPVVGGNGGCKRLRWCPPEIALPQGSVLGCARIGYVPRLSLDRPRAVADPAAPAGAYTTAVLCSCGSNCTLVSKRSAIAACAPFAGDERLDRAGQENGAG